MRNTLYRALFWVFIPAGMVAVAYALTRFDSTKPLFEIPGYRTAGLHEFIWLVSGAFAYFMTIRHLPELVRDWREMRMTGSSTLPLTALGYLIREVMRMSIAVGTIVLGLFACFQGSPLPGPTQISLVGLVLTIVLLYQSAFNGVISMVDWWFRLMIERSIIEDHESTNIEEEILEQIAASGQADEGHPDAQEDDSRV